MKTIRIEIPQYIRTVKTSNKQNPSYFEWNGNTIKGKKKKLLLGYIKPQYKDYIQILPEYLKDDYCIGIFHDKKLIEVCSSIKQILLSEKNYQIVYKYIVINKITKEKIIANQSQVGKPKFITISGQDIFSGNLREHLKGTIFQAIKQSFAPYVKDIPVISNYPVRIKMYIYDTVKNFNDNTIKNDTGTRWDLGNRAYPYGKAFLDLLVTGTDGTNKLIESKLIDDDRLHVTEDPQGGIFVPLSDNDDSKRKLVFIIKEDKRKSIKNNKFYNGEYNKNLGKSIDFKSKKLTNQMEIKFLSGLGIKMSDSSTTKFNNNDNEVEFKRIRGESTETEDNLL